MESKAKSQRKFLFRATVLIPASMVLAFAQVPSGSLGGTFSTNLRPRFKAQKSQSKTKTLPCND